MYACMYSFICLDTYVRIHIRVCICTYTHVYIHVYMQTTCIYSSLCVYMSVHMFAYVLRCLLMDEVIYLSNLCAVYFYTYMHACMHVCIHTYR